MKDKEFEEILAQLKLDLIGSLIPIDDSIDTSSDIYGSVDGYLSQYDSISSAAKDIKNPHK